MAKQTNEQVEKNLQAVLAGNVTQAQLDAWKQEFIKEHIIKVRLNQNELLTGYFKKPKRDIIANCVNLTHEGKLFEAREFLWNNSWLGGDITIKTNEDAAMSGQVKLWGCYSFLQAEAQTY